MSPEEILETIPVVDAHSDLLSDLVYLRRQGQTHVIADKWLPGLRAGGVKVVVAAIFIETLFVPQQATEIALEQIDCLHQEIAESPGLYRLCVSAADTEAALARNEIAFWLSLEGAEPVGTNLSLLRIFHQLGVRLVGPTWGRRNAVGEGSTWVGEPNPFAGGLSDFGKALVREAEQLGMLLDLSHLNDRGAQDVAQLTHGTLFASHSDTRSLNPVERNLSDALIRLIAGRCGVIGINAANIICASEEKDATPETLVRHMEHIRDIAGVQHVGLGLDLIDNVNQFGPVLPLDQSHRPLRDVVSGHAGLRELVGAMQKRGWDDGAIRAVLGGNFLRMFRENLPR